MLSLDSRAALPLRPTAATPQTSAHRSRRGQQRGSQRRPAQKHLAPPAGQQTAPE